MTRMARPSPVLVLFATLLVACGRGSTSHDATPVAPDGPSPGAEVANAEKLDGGPDFAARTPADSPVFAPDAPDAPDAPGDVPGDADASSDATADGEAGNPEPQPRVLIIDPATDKFLSYDRDGQIVYDYHPTLDFGAGYAKRSIRQEAISVAWDATASAYRNSDYPAPLPGLVEPLRPSRIVVVAASTSGLSARAKIIGVDGNVVADRSVPADHMDVRVSPAQKFLYAAQHVGGGGSSDWCSEGTHAVVTRVTDGTGVWQGFLCTAAFARDDSHLAFSPTIGCPDPPIHVVDLSTGQATVVDSPAPCDAGVGSAYLRGASTLGAVFGRSNSLLPWFADWQGKSSPFAPTLPTSLTDTYVVRLHPQGSGVLWGGPARQEFQLASLTSQPWTGFHDNCYGQPDRAFVKLQGQALRYCQCSDGTCTLLATLAAPAEGGWTPSAQLSPDGRFVFVTYSWALDRLPAAGQDRLLYRSTGELLFSASARFSGEIMFDQTGQLAVLRSQRSSDGPSELAIINLSNGQATTLPFPGSYTIVYQ